MQLGKILIFAGAIMITVGGLILLLPKMPFLGRLPGDISIKKENFSLYIPITTSIVLSVILSLLLWLFRSK